MSTLNKNEYYLNITTEQFLGGREILKSMPIFYNRVYFCKRYASILWDASTSENRTFNNISLVTSEQDAKQLRQIIKNNFLYLSDWDSINYIDNQDYGFSFIAGNIKFVVMIYNEYADGYIVKSYNPESGEYFATKVEGAKEFFLDTSINSNGEIVRTCIFDPDDINDENTIKKIAEKKAMSKTAVYGNAGRIPSSVELIVLIITFGLVITWSVYLLSSFFR